MPDIFHTFIVNAPADKVFNGITTEQGLDSWWTISSKADPAVGGNYNLYFGPEYDWNATVTKYSINKEFELQMTEADADWHGTLVGFTLDAMEDNTTIVNFYHTGWPENNDHYRISSYCWAMYLRLLKRYVEFGERVIYDQRLEV